MERVVKRSQVRFIMDAEDERPFIRAIVAEPETVLVGGPPWQTSDAPPLDSTRLPNNYYLLIWNRREVPVLKAKKSDGVWEVANEGNLTIQFLRSQFWDETILCEGRIAVATTSARSVAVERRYRKLRKWLQGAFRNNVVRWWHPLGPKTAKNPSEPDRTLWVGPSALQWLRSNSTHKFKQDRFGITEAIPLR
jgi:hypothetical protein